MSKEMGSQADNWPCRGVCSYRSIPRNAKYHYHISWKYNAYFHIREASNEK